MVSIANALQLANKKKVLKIINIQQLPELPAGCEITSTAMVLNYFNLNVNKMDLLDYLPIMKKKDSNGRWDSPWNKFIGDPQLNYYGAYCTVIEELLRRYFETNHINDFVYYHQVGINLDDLLKEIDLKHPVLIWVTINMKPTKKTASWITQDGDEFTWLANEHCVVLMGYDLENNKIIVSDPYDKRGNVMYKREIIEQRYKDMQMQSVIVYKKKKFN